MRAWGNSDKGLHRPTNQDSFFIDIIKGNDTAILVVCDGMGGANAGHIASKYAIEGYVGEIKRSLRPDLDAEQWKEILLKAVQQANIYVHDISGKQPEFYGMGTTLVSAVVTKDHTFFVNVGDSRGYKVENGDILQITKDHSFVEEMVREGHLTRDEAKSHPRRNLITRAIGVEGSIKPDIYPIALGEGQKILLCSDGLVNMVSDQEILSIIQLEEKEETACERLMEKAKQAGGLDNITIVLFTK